MPRSPASSSACVASRPSSSLRRVVVSMFRARARIAADRHSGDQTHDGTMAARRTRPAGIGVCGRPRRGRRDDVFGEPEIRSNREQSRVDAVQPPRPFWPESHRGRRAPFVVLVVSMFRAPARMAADRHSGDQTRRHDGRTTNTTGGIGGCSIDDRFELRAVAVHPVQYPVSLRRGHGARRAPFVAIFVSHCTVMVAFHAALSGSSWSWTPQPRAVVRFWDVRLWFAVSTPTLRAGQLVCSGCGSEFML